LIVAWWNVGRKRSTKKKMLRRAPKMASSANGQKHPRGERLFSENTFQNTRRYLIPREKKHIEKKLGALVRLRCVWVSVRSDCCLCHTDWARKTHHKERGKERTLPSVSNLLRLLLVELGFRDGKMTQQVTHGDVTARHIVETQ
jgi:hypothetical protein